MLNPGPASEPSGAHNGMSTVVTRSSLRFMQMTTPTSQSTPPANKARFQISLLSSTRRLPALV
jgi:hypothetical protein